MNTWKAWAAVAGLVALSGAAQAALVSRGGGMVYDTTRNITWLADMNYAQTSVHTGTGVQADGSMTWAAAKAWADNLVYGGYGDWRLPTLNPADASCSLVVGIGFNCSGGELSGLFVTDLGRDYSGSGPSTSDDTPAQIANLALFSNVQPANYWSGTRYVPGPGNAWSFHAGGNGFQTYSAEVNRFYVVAVRPGDIAASVPEPQTLALALLALGATATARRRRSD